MKKYNETFSIICAKCGRKKYHYKANYLHKPVPRLCTQCQQAEKRKEVEKAVLQGVPYGVAIYTPLPEKKVVQLVCASCAAVFKAKWEGGPYTRDKHPAYCAKCRESKTHGYVGIDPGAPLTMALVTPTGRWVAHAGEDTVSVPAKVGVNNSPKKVVDLLRKWQSTAAFPLKMVIENVGPMPGEGIVSAAKFVGSIWLARTAAAALDMEVLMVVPQKWKKYYGLSSKKGESNVIARQLFPNRAYRVEKEKDHDYAEAALLARYAVDIQGNDVVKP
jgi:crossover junction endodeoxyribonuclease RuvC